MTTKRILLTILLVFSIAAGACTPALYTFPASATALSPEPVAGSAMPPASQAQYLAIIVLDACRPEYFDLASMPNLTALMQEGAYYDDAWLGQLISNTPPGHASLSTGLFPSHTGIVGFSWKDPDTNRMYRPTSLEAINAGKLAKVMQDAGARNLIDWFKAAHPNAKALTISAHKFFAADAMGEPSADYIVYAATSREGALTNQELPQGPQKQRTIIPGAVRGHEPPAEIMNDPKLRLDPPFTPGAQNSWAIDVALAIFEKEHPQVMMINLPETDEKGHASGGIIAPDVMRPVMEEIDRDLGRLIEAYKVAGIYDQTIFVVTADHGMIPNDRNIDPAQFRSLRRFGQVGKPYTWLSNPSQAAIVAEAIAKLNVPDVIGIYAKIKDASGAYHFESAPTTQAKLDPTLNAAYLYLTSTFASSHGPDIVLTSSENTQFGKASTGKRGGHSEVTWGDQHIPLLIVGPGVKQGVVSHAPARLVDIAPTVLALLGIVHGPMDGVVLADALVSPSTDQLAAQTKVTNELTPLRDALRARSQADLAGQR